MKGNRRGREQVNERRQRKETRGKERGNKGRENMRSEEKRKKGSRLYDGTIR